MNKTLNCVARIQIVSMFMWKQKTFIQTLLKMLKPQTWYLKTWCSETAKDELGGRTIKGFIVLQRTLTLEMMVKLIRKEKVQRNVLSREKPHSKIKTTTWKIYLSKM